MEVEVRNKFQNDCAKDILSSMLVRYGKLGNVPNDTLSAVVLDYPVIEQFTGGTSEVGLTMQIPSYFYKPTGSGSYKCASYLTLKDTEINLEDFHHYYNPTIERDHHGASFWKECGNKYLAMPLFTADIYAYGGKHDRYIEIWMVDGEYLVNEDMLHELISWHYSYPWGKNEDFSEISLNCISSEFVLSQDKNMDPSTFMQLCRDNCVKKVPQYRAQVKTARTYTSGTVDIPGGMDIREFFKSAKPRMK